MNAPVMKRVVLFALGLSMLVCAACAQPDVPPAEVRSSSDGPGDRAAGPAVAAAAPRIVFLGDSLTAGYGLAKEESVPSLIQMRLRSERVSVSMWSTPASPAIPLPADLSRLDWSLEGDVRMLVIERLRTTVFAVCPSPT